MATTRLEGRPACIADGLGNHYTRRTTVFKSFARLGGVPLRSHRRSGRFPAAGQGGSDDLQVVAPINAL